MIPEVITEAMIEAGANALAERFFVVGTQQKLAFFSDSQQQDFRTKARAVIQVALEAAPSGHGERG